MTTSEERFKANMRFFEIEAHSYCNRKCWFCPNSFIDRTGPVKFLDYKIYFQVLKDLASINYSGTMVFAGFSEPFSQTEIIEYIGYAKKSLPDAMLSASSNTDYLTTDLVRSAERSGLNVIRAQLYFDKEQDYNDIAIRKKMDTLKSKLMGIEFKEGVHCQWFALVGDNLVIHAYSKNFHERGYDRCGVSVGKEKQPRGHTCCEPVTAFGINHNGWAVPCCQIRSDYEPHKDFLLGKMNDTPGRIFELYRGAIFSETQFPCSTCGFFANHGNPKLIYSRILKELQNGKNRIRTHNGCKSKVGSV